MGESPGEGDQRPGEVVRNMPSRDPDPLPKRAIRQCPLPRPRDPRTRDAEHWRIEPLIPHDGCNPRSGSQASTGLDHHHPANRVSPSAPTPSYRGVAGESVRLPVIPSASGGDQPRTPPPPSVDPEPGGGGPDLSLLRVVRREDQAIWLLGRECPQLRVDPLFPFE